MRDDHGESPKLPIGWITGTVSNLGLVVDISVSPGSASISDVPARKTKRSTTCSGQAILDTGTTRTVIDRKIVDELGMTPVGVLRLTCVGVQEPIVSDAYLIAVTLPNFGRPIQTLAAATDLQLHGFDCVFGLDLLGNGELNLNGPNKTFYFKRLTQ